MNRLHIGGTERKTGWTCLNVQEADYVDIVGDCREMQEFPDCFYDTIYASHVLEHLSYSAEVMPTLKEWRRILKPTGELWLSVPNLDALCELFLRAKDRPDLRFHVMRIIYGGQTDPHDVHRAGFAWDIMCGYLQEAGFAEVRQIDVFPDFQDTSQLEIAGIPISLNLVAKPTASR